MQVLLGPDGFKGRANQHQGILTELKEGLLSSSYHQKGEQGE